MSPLTPLDVQLGATYTLARRIARLRWLRREARRAVDELLELVDALDRLDGDPDLEPANDDEPSLGWPERGPSPFDENSTDECELDPDTEVTATERHGRGFALSRYPDDSEEEGEDFDDDLEPSLGSLNPEAGRSQISWSMGGLDDLEGSEVGI